ncbi:MAG: serine/threonine-protein kinase PknD [Mycobacterium sp.]
MEGTPFGKYRLLELLGQGGMGQVWRAYDTDTKRYVAVKVLPETLANDTDFQQRFRREAQAAASLNEPHVIPIHQFGEIDGRLFVDMRLIEGSDLESVLRDGPLPAPRAVAVVEQIAWALAAAHRIGLVHRDIKPSNILIADNDFAYLIDFGIARVAGQTALTNTGMTVGTWAYMAPERFSSGVVDPRTDIYSLTCVLFEILTGRRPFPGESPEQQIGGHLAVPPPKPSQLVRSVPAALDAVIAAGMAKQPYQRYRTTTELADRARAALTAAPAQRPTPSHSPPPPMMNRAPMPPKTPMPSPPQAQLPYGSQPQMYASQPGRQPGPYGAAPMGPGQQGPHYEQSWWKRNTALIAIGAVLVTIVLLGTAIAVVSRSGDSSSAQSSSSRTSTSREESSSQTPTSEVIPTDQSVLPFSGLNFPIGITVDDSGDMYVVDNKNNRVVVMTESGTQSVLPFTGLDTPAGIALDDSGDVYVTDVNNNRVLRLAAGASTQEVLPFTGLSSPSRIVIDDSGAVLVTDYDNNRVLRLPRGSSNQEELPFTGLSSPSGIALDDSGAVYVTDGGNGRIVKLEDGSEDQEEVPFTNLGRPVGVAVSPGGAIYVTDFDDGQVLVLNAGDQEALPFPDLSSPNGIALDSSGALYVTESAANRVLKLSPE